METIPNLSVCQNVTPDPISVSERDTRSNVCVKTWHSILCMWQNVTPSPINTTTIIFTLIMCILIIIQSSVDSWHTIVRLYSFHQVWSIVPHSHKYMYYNEAITNIYYTNMKSNHHLTRNQALIPPKALESSLSRLFSLVLGLKTYK